MADWRADLEALDRLSPEVAPPAGLQRRIEARLFGARPSGLARLWASAGLWRAVAAAAVVAAVWFGVYRPPAPPPSGLPEARLVSALASVDSDVSLLAVYEPQAAVLNISRTSGGAPPGRSLELWLIEGSSPPVSLGVLPDSPLARVPLSRDLAAEISAGSTLAVTQEPAGGAPNGAPTGPVVAAGEVSEI